MENSLRSIIDQSNSILILLPTKPYFDQVAAGLSLYLALREQKDISIVSPSPMVVEFNRLVGVNKVTQELGNKNLIITFTDYKASDIERVSYDIEGGQFRLAVIPKPGAPAPTKEQAQLSFAGVSADTVILVGGVNESHFPAISSKDLAGAKLVHVGNRQLTLSSDKQAISLARPTSSSSELVAKLIKESGLDIDADIATNLLMGIEEGTNRYSSSDISAETFALVADLMRAGGQRVTRVRPQKPITTGVVSPPYRPRVTKDDQKPKTPKDWLEPKIYKGTSVS